MIDISTLNMIGPRPYPAAREDRMSLESFVLEVVLPLGGLALMEGVVRLFGPPLSRVLAPRHELTVLKLGASRAAEGP
jgi:hypothetical protein